MGILFRRDLEHSTLTSLNAVEITAGPTEDHLSTLLSADF